LAFFGGVFGFLMFWQSGNPECACRRSAVVRLAGSTAVGYAVGRRTIVVLCYAYIYSSKHIFGLCIILSYNSSKKYSNLFWHILSLYQ